jgi:hypothetical protein
VPTPDGAKKAAGLSSTEVTEEMANSVSTARPYIKGINGKMDAHCRDGEIQSGKQAGLIRNG